MKTIKIEINNPAFDKVIETQVPDGFDELGFMDFMNLHGNLLIEGAISSLFKGYKLGGGVKFEDVEQEASLTSNAILSIITHYYAGTSPLKDETKEKDYSMKYV